DVRPERVSISVAHFDAIIGKDNIRVGRGKRLALKYRSRTAVGEIEHDDGRTAGVREVAEVFIRIDAYIVQSGGTFIQVIEGINAVDGIRGEVNLQQFESTFGIASRIPENRSFGRRF